jgi:hypothetical protein
VELCPAAIAEVEKINSWETLSLAKGQLGHVYAVQGKRQEALEIAGASRCAAAHIERGGIHGSDTWNFRSSICASA